MTRELILYIDKKFKLLKYAFSCPGVILPGIIVGIPGIHVFSDSSVHLDILFLFFFCGASRKKKNLLLFIRLKPKIDGLQTFFILTIWTLCNNRRHG
jgi:hypothetical protein